MSVTLWSALLCQAVSAALLRHRLGKTWLRRPATLLVLASVLYDGVSQVLLSFPSVGDWDTYRTGVQQGYVDQANLIMSAGMLAFTVCYLLTQPQQVRAAPADAGSVARVLDWRLLALACLPLAVLTYEGRGYNSAVTAPGAPVAPELASTFFVLIVALTAFSVLLRRPGWFLPVLLAQSLLLAAAGERTPVIADAIVLIILLARTGRCPSARQLAATAAVAVTAILAIMGVRAQQGRALYHQDTGLDPRVSALASGLTGGTASQGSPGLLAQAAVRLDGADFGGAVLQSERMGQPHLGAAGVPESLLLAVPSVLWPAKASAGALNPVAAEIVAFGLQRVNFVPGLAGMYVGFLPPAWLIAFLGALGVPAGWGERWLLRRWTAGRLVLLAGAVTAATGYEGGLQGIVLELRAALVVTVAATAAGTLLL